MTDYKRNVWDFLNGTPLNVTECLDTYVKNWSFNYCQYNYTFNTDGYSMRGGIPLDTIAPWFMVNSIEIRNRNPDPFRGLVSLLHNNFSDMVWKISRKQGFSKPRYALEIGGKVYHHDTLDGLNKSYCGG